MKRLLPLALLASFPTFVQAQTQTTWTGYDLFVSGDRDNGCDLRVVEVTHSGGHNAPLRMFVWNNDRTPMRVLADVRMSGNGSSRSSQVEGLIGGGVTGSLRGAYPMAGSFDHSRVVIRFLACRPPH